MECKFRYIAGFVLAKKNLLHKLYVFIQLGLHQIKPIKKYTFYIAVYHLEYFYYCSKLNQKLKVNFNDCLKLKFIKC